MRRRMKGSKNLKASRDPRDLRGRVENPKQPPKLQVLSSGSYYGGHGDFLVTAIGILGAFLPSHLLSSPL
ncbi:hypothetical protein HPP92_016483 [Vanilla planifolia]|uniref:Uncharacterized protein n=1 Tax=Vanilla planifolia TaxID=51239 RepID=A0A835US41_VANPL|nr:hypothetical protein HPP92_016483 [Vanilla planifolia]